MDVFVFPLVKVVFYPTTGKPLNIIEEKDIQMIKDAIQEKVPVALALVDEPSQIFQYMPREKLDFVRPIAGYGFPVVLETRQDGSLLVFLQGQGKVELGKTRNLGRPYIVCEGTPLIDHNSLVPENVAAYLTMSKVLIQWMETHIPDAQGREKFMDSVKTPDEVVGCYASYLLSDVDLQQMVLEMNDINKKVQFISRLIESGEIIR